MGSQVYLVLTLVFYAVAALHVVLRALSRSRLITPWALTANLAGFALHTASLAQRWTELGRFPASGLRDVASLMAWALVLVFLAVYLRTRLEALGLAVCPAAFLLVLLACLLPAETRQDPMLRGLFLPVHTTFAFFGYAALFVASALGLLYLMQERELRSRTPRAFYYMIPSLERCDTLSAHAVDVGFVFLSLAIVTGMLWNHSARGHYWTGDAKEISATCAWFLYVSLIVARKRTGWGGRRAAVIGLVGFLVVVLTFVWATLFATVADASR